MTAADGDRRHAGVWALDPSAAATLSQNDRQRVVADRQTQDALRSTQARTMIPDVLAGLNLGGAPRATAGGSPIDANGDVVVSAPVQHKTVADL